MFDNVIMNNAQRKADLKKCQKQLKKAELQFNEKYNNTTDLENNEVELD